MEHGPLLLAAGLVAVVGTAGCSLARSTISPPGDPDASTADVGLVDADSDAAPPDDSGPSPDAADGATLPCADGMRNGTETDIDCGGGTCPPCEVGGTCAVITDCAAVTCFMGTCADVLPTCTALHAAAPAVASGIYHLDADGSGPAPMRDAYCEMTTADGGWELVSVVTPGTGTLLFGDAFCTDPAVPDCRGHVPPGTVAAAGQVLIAAPADSEWMIYSGFSGSPTSALRRVSREIAILETDVCFDPNTCMNTTDDPALTVSRTSGHVAMFEAPLSQWWRLSGWYVGSGASPGIPTAIVHSSGYAGSNVIASRDSATAPSVTISSSRQLIYYRVP
jgi:hypothetical protein